MQYARLALLLPALLVTSAAAGACGDDEATGSTAAASGLPSGVGGGGGSTSPAGSGAGAPAGTGSGGDAGVGGQGGSPGPSPGVAVFEERVQPALAEACGSCHVGPRFAFASLLRAGDAFTAAESAANYDVFYDLLSLDAPGQSRLLAKMLGPDAEGGMAHAAGAVAGPGDAVFDEVAAWIEVEKAFSCADCGTTAEVAWLAVVEQPELFWALAADPFRSDHGLRDRARILMQPMDPATLQPQGEPVDFLGDGFCGADGRCDFASLAVSHAGDRLAFACRLSLEGADWVNEVRWNICVAEIGDDGRAVNPRFLLPGAQRHQGSTVARSDPFGVRVDGEALKGPYDLHFQTRRRRDATPAFSPDDERIYYASQGPDPRTGAQATQAYHGFEHLDHIVAVNVDGSDPRTIYVNEGGVADHPFFLRNGNVAFHTWNLERMDRHLYQQSRADGMGEIPALLGRTQGPNMWGQAVQLANGGILGATGRRRSAIENYVLFFGDHTLGTGLDPSIAPLAILDTTVFEQVLDFPTGYCESPPDGPSCAIDQFYADPSYAPDGRAFIAHNPERTYVSQGEDMFLGYASGSTPEEQVESMRAFVPHRLGVSLVDHRGAVTRVLEPPAGKALRWPAWVGRRQPPRVQAWTADESEDTAEIHVADVPLWLGFARQNDTTHKANDMAVLDRVVALRVLEKDLAGNFCLSDARPYRYAANDGAHDHPTHLGKNNSTGYTRLVVAADAGGDAWGDVPLAADRSVRLTVPAGKLLLFQGIDADGHAIAQRSRLLAMPPGTRSDASVRREQYDAQCMSCHGTLTADATFRGLSEIDLVDNPGLDYATVAAAAAPADVAGATRRPATFLAAMRPLLDERCVSCHSGGSPAAELSLEAEYSSSGNYPAGKWATEAGLADPAYLAFVPPESRVPAYNYSVSFAWNFREDEAPYKEHPAYAPLIAAHAPLGGLAPWDPAYQNLFAHGESRWVYLGSYYDANFGRSDRLGGLSSDAWLIEILTGRDLDPTRSFGGLDHTGFLDEAEAREVMAVIDVGFPYAARCDDRTVPSGPNAGQPWGEPSPP